MTTEKEIKQLKKRVQLLEKRVNELRHRPGLYVIGLDRYAVKFADSDDIGCVECT